MKTNILIVALSTAVLTGVTPGARADEPRDAEKSAAIVAAAERDTVAMEKRMAQEKRELAKKIAWLNAAARKNDERVCFRISGETTVPIQKLKEDRASTGLGYGELLVANEIAAASDKTMAAVLVEFQAGKDWSTIATENNVKLHRILACANRVIEVITCDQHSSPMIVSSGAADLARTFPNGLANFGAINNTSIGNRSRPGCVYIERY